MTYSVMMTEIAKNLGFNEEMIKEFINDPSQLLSEPEIEKIFKAYSTILKQEKQKR